MTFLAAVILKLVLLLWFAVLPGLGFLAWMDFRWRSRLDLALAMFGAGMALAGLGVYALLLANAYQAYTAWLIPLVPAGWLLYRYRRTGRFLPAALEEETAPPPAPEAARAGKKKLSPAPAPRPAEKPAVLDGVAVFCCGFLLLASFLEAAASPLHTWDAVVTWDKWATQWALRSNLYHCAQGGYPQLLPMFGSLLYKITGRFDPLPEEQYALHALHPLLGLLLLGACVRAAQLFRAPAWVVLLAVFGCRTLAAALTAGSADLLVTLMVALAAVFYAGWQQRAWSARWEGGALLAAAVFGAAFSKATGWCVVLLLLAASIRRLAGGRLVRKPLLAGALALPVLVLLPFYASQYAASREPIERMRLDEVNFRFRPVLHDFQGRAGASYTNPGGWSRLGEAGQKFLADYSLPPSFTGALAFLPVLLLVGLLAAAGAGCRAARPALLTAVVLLAAWYRLVSYDLRNLLPALPLLGVCLAAGAVRWLAWLDRLPAARWTAAGLLGFFALMTGAGIAAEATGLVESTLLDGRLEARLAAAEAGFPQSAQAYFGQEYDTWNFLSRQGFFGRARHVIAISYLYRWLPAGIYASCDWNSAVVAPGDLFIGLPGDAPPGAPEGWTKLQSAGGLQVFVRDRNPVRVPLENLEPAGSTPPRLVRPAPGRLDADAGGAESMLAYNLPERNLRAGFSVVWRVTVEAADADPALAACTRLYSPAIADPQLSAASVDLTEAGSRTIRYSGVLGIRPVVLSADPRDEIRFGICRTGSPRTVSLRDFRYTVYGW